MFLCILGLYRVVSCGYVLHHLLCWCLCPSSIVSVNRRVVFEWLSNVHVKARDRPRVTQWLHCPVHTPHTDVHLQLQRFPYAAVRADIRHRWSLTRSTTYEGSGVTPPVLHTVQYLHPLYGCLSFQKCRDVPFDYISQMFYHQCLQCLKQWLHFQTFLLLLTCKLFFFPFVFEVMVKSMLCNYGLCLDLDLSLCRVILSMCSWNPLLPQQQCKV